ncbi:oxygenase MpaB family protein [Archangium sp.]|uniref:oxygenase MpaB family protein n=1 Tax=Archangium sp. TaxID=1872627 RepID=UPI002D55A700|nr:oxygenase MpaB family protein [Archangium sp.]HYO53451.1 oxygenase MpaB family protein [Archangium sp.]
MTDMRWANEFLDSMREVCDPPADEAVQSLFTQGLVGSANELMKQLVAHETVSAEQLPVPLRGYFEQSAKMPSWADRELIREGQAVFSRCGSLSVVALVCASLPTCYAGAEGVQVLHLTARLETDTKRRIVETAQMVVDVMSPGGLEPDGWGIRDAQKVRLMHAAVRHLIRQSGRWNPEWGQPINQEDMAGTLVTFSVVTIRALEKMGYTLEPREAQAYYHAWRVVGYLMGVDERLLPEKYEDGARLADSIFARVFRASTEGQVMTRALIELMEHIIPGNIFDGLSSTLIRYLVGDSTADLIAVPASDWTQSLIKPLRLLGWVMDEGDEQNEVSAKLSELFGRKLLEGIVWVSRGHERPPFRIPEALRVSWNVRSREQQLA